MDAAAALAVIKALSLEERVEIAARLQDGPGGAGRWSGDTAAAVAALEALPFDERFDLGSRLWDGAVEAGWQPKPSEGLVAELRRRIALHEADPTRARTWEQVMTHITRPR